jgi:hypothetical protein
MADSVLTDNCNTFQREQQQLMTDNLSTFEHQLNQILDEMIQDIYNTGEEAHETLHTMKD